MQDKTMALNGPLSPYQADIAPTPYPDLHAHVTALAEKGLLVVIDEPINKDTEMHPLVRWQYRGGIEEADRKAFLFTRPTDRKGCVYDAAVLVAGLAARSEYFDFADELVQGRRKDVAMNDPVPRQNDD